MSTLVVVAYPNEFQAEEVRLRLLKMQQEYLVMKCSCRNNRGEYYLNIFLL